MHRVGVDIGVITHKLAQRIERDAQLVWDDFYNFLNIATTIKSSEVGPEIEDVPGNGTRLRVPPVGDPVFTVCTDRSGSALVCRNLREAENVPIGAPVYMLQAAPDWPIVTKPPVETPQPPRFARRCVAAPCVGRLVRRVVTGGGGGVSLGSTGSVPVAAVR